jgi:small subunit ribosomal protein S16
VAVKIRLKRLGKVRVPQYRIVVVDSRKKRDGKVIEEIGKYHPKEEPSLIDVVSDRAQYWLGVGAQPSDAVHTLLKITGDWQKFKGLPGAEGRLQVKEPKRSKQDIFNEALKAAEKEPKAEAVTKRSSKKATRAEDKPAEAKPADEKSVEESADQAPVAESPAEHVEAAAADEAPGAKAEAAEGAAEAGQSEA